MRIVYTRHDGGVSVCHPAPQVLTWMTFGGCWTGCARGFVEAQIERQIESGIDANAAHRFACAMAFGGCTSAEALEIIRDRDCGHLGTAHELWDINDVPKDRWFRDAWVRSHNGGSIGVHLGKARRIHYQRLTAATAKSRAVIQLGRWRDRIKKAETPEDLRRLWPDGLT